MLSFLRTKSHEEHADYWRVMKDQFALSLMWTWEELSEVGIKQAVFVQRYQDPLSLYHDIDEPKTLYGQEALRHRFAEVQDAMESRKTSITLCDLMPFKLYSWLLNKDETRLLQGWISTLTHDLCNQKALVNAGIRGSELNGKDVALASAMVSARGASSSSFSASRMVSELPTVSKKAAANKGEKKAEDSMANMMKFFVGKGKKA
jgi:hypothetical protein